MPPPPITVSCAIVGGRIYPPFTTRKPPPPVPAFGPIARRVMVMGGYGLALSESNNNNEK